MSVEFFLSSCSILNLIGPIIFVYLLILRNLVAIKYKEQCIFFLNHTFFNLKI